MISEKLKKIKWERRTSSEQHFILMYLYRCKTDPAGLEANYIETARFRKIGIKRSDIPVVILTLPAEELREMAYQVIGEPLP